MIPQDITVWSVFLFFSVMGYSGDVMPEDPALRRVHSTKEACERFVPVVRRALEKKPPPISPKQVACRSLKMEKQVP